MISWRNEVDNEKERIINDLEYPAETAACNLMAIPYAVGSKKALTDKIIIKENEESNPTLTLPVNIVC